MRIVEDREEKKLALDVLIRHLEESPDTARREFIKSDETYGAAAILCLDVGHVDCKGNV